MQEQSFSFRTTLEKNHLRGEKISRASVAVSLPNAGKEVIISVQGGSLLVKMESLV